MRTLSLLLLIALVACNNPQSTQYQIEWMSLPANGNHGLPYLETGLDGVLRCSWVETSGDTATLKFSEFRNDQWNSPEFVASGTDWFVNWADYPKVSASENAMIAHYLQKSAPDTYAYDVRAKVRGETGWNEAFKVHEDTTQTEHGFVSILPLSQDKFRLVWLDGRNTTGAHAGAMTIRTAIIDSRGDITDRTLLDERVCDCCATAATNSKNGPIVAYRDRSNEEIRDIYFTQLNHENWTTPEVVYPDFWEIAGCPVNGPSLDASNEIVALGWFTGAQNSPKVQLSLSSDGGNSFAQPFLIDDQEPFGRVAVKILDNDRIAVVWLARNGEQAFIKLKLLNQNGSTLKEMVITETSGARASGFPQIAVHNGYLYFANTHTATGALQIQVGRMKFK